MFFMREIREINKNRTPAGFGGLGGPFVAGSQSGLGKSQAT
jgi:hypothetical protein